MDASKPTEGSGLGLAIARSLAELHGGGLRIRSCEGTGTIVLVQLPVKPQTGLEIVSAARHEGAWRGRYQPADIQRSQADRSPSPA